ncbi:hypothetical protein [Curtanaerobium respiraculi]|uniref:hypothetical protein n=1 Tax=Curtanaerobium respiraculi TaxID=2949669 RepID=UPI0024B36E59|nr:hypothetical protein [Curtanaerobium respiraculi]
MKDSDFGALIEGTSALKPGCSRYGNENERIISFQDALIQAGGVRASEARGLKRFMHRLAAAYERSQMAGDMRSGSLEGEKASRGVPAWKLAAAGSVYSIMGLAAIIIGS